MARRLRPLADREAILALGLAGAGFLSLEATLPAAGALAIRSIRTPRASDGSGPALGVLVLGTAWISFLLGYPTLRAMWITASEHHDPARVAAFVAGWLVLAAAATWLANFLVRCHPERVVARALARAGIVSVIAAGLLQLVTVTQTMLAQSTRRCGASVAECLGSPPWASLAPALAIGAVWFTLSLSRDVLAQSRRARPLSQEGGLTRARRKAS